MRKIICYIATSADGYIARPDGSVEWLEAFDTGEDYEMTEFYASIDTILWGRKTYDFMIRMGEKFDPKVRNYVFSRNPPASPAADTIFVVEPVGDFTKRLMAEEGRNIWMMGGGQIIASFLDAGFIDEFMLFVMPVLLGEGIPLIHPGHRPVSLRLVKSRQYENGVMLLHYAVRR